MTILKWTLGQKFDALAGATHWRRAFVRRPRTPPATFVEILNGRQWPGAARLSNFPGDVPPIPFPSLKVARMLTIAQLAMLYRLSQRQIRLRLREWNLPTARDARRRVLVPATLFRAALVESLKANESANDY